MDMQDYANIGSAVLTGNPAYVGGVDAEALRARNYSKDLRKLAAYAVPTEANLKTRIDGPMVGWTTPSLTFDKMRQINGSTLSLNFDIEKNVKRKPFKDAWDQWFKSWQTFFARYQTTGGKLSALIDSDLVASQTESFRLQLVGDPSVPPHADGRPGDPGWIAAYEAEGTPDAPVPPSSAHPVPKVDPKPPVDKKKPWWDFSSATDDKPDDKPVPTPWWVIGLYVTGGVGVVAGSYFLIRRKVIQGHQAEHFIKRDVLPIVLGGYMGPTGVALAHSATNRFSPATDPSGVGGPTFIGPERV